MHEYASLPHVGVGGKRTLKSGVLQHRLAGNLVGWWRDRGRLGMGLLALLLKILLIDKIDLKLEIIINDTTNGQLKKLCQI
jgi:hypothetical protein